MTKRMLACLVLSVLLTVMLCVCHRPIEADSLLVPAVTTYIPIVASPPGDSLGRILPTDLTYEGAFRLPETSHSLDNVGWEWGGTALTYYTQGNAQGAADELPGSLFGAGHDQTQWVSEVSIPQPVLSSDRDLVALNVARTLQPFSDIRGELYQGVLDEWALLRAGLASLPLGEGAQPLLYFCWADHAPGNPDSTDPTHGWRSLDLDDGDSHGLWRVGEYPEYVTADYMFEIPAEWANAHVDGRRLATGRYRDGGQAGQGPSLLAIAPWADESSGSPSDSLDAVPLLLYQAFDVENAGMLEGYHHSDAWEGGAWLSVGQRQAVVFAGTKGVGDCWYGCSDGTIWPEEPPYPEECPERGWWSSEFMSQLIFYDVDDLATVAAGEMEPWEPQPYATLELDPWLWGVSDSRQKHHVGAIAYDSVHRRLFLMEPLVDADRPLVHVWSVN